MLSPEAGRREHAYHTIVIDKITNKEIGVTALKWPQKAMIDKME